MVDFTIYIGVASKNYVGVSQTIMYIHQLLLHVRMNTIWIIEILRFPLLIR